MNYVRKIFCPLPIIMIAFTLMSILAGCAPKPPKGLTTQQERGWDIYVRRCAACHRIKNKGGGSASELTHIASRRNRQELTIWIQDPKSANPRTKMPPTNLSGRQVQDIVSYLMTLK